MHVDMPKSIEKVKWRFPLDYFELFHFPRTIVSNCLLNQCYLFFWALYAVFCHSGASQLALVCKNPPANAGDWGGFSPWVGRISWRRIVEIKHQMFNLENSTDRGAWRAMSHGVQRAGHDWSDLAHTSL